jgi:hypothetical protein
VIGSAGGSSRRTRPVRALGDDAGEQVLACGPAGSLLIFDGSTWHGHSANVSGGSRRSVQGAFIPRARHAAVDWRAPAARDARPTGHARAVPTRGEVMAAPRYRTGRAEKRHLSAVGQRTAATYRGTCNDT